MKTPIASWNTQILLTLGCVILLCTGSVRNAAGQADDLSRTTLAEQIELPRLVDLCAQRLALNIEYDERVLQGNVTVRLGAGVTDAELWAFTNQVLASRGFTSVQMPGENVLSIVKLNDAPGLARTEGPEGITSEAGYVSVVARVEHRPVNDVVTAVKLVLSKPAGTVTPMGKEGLIRISDLKGRIDEAMRIVELIDTPGQRAVVEKIPAKFVSAAQLSSLVTLAANSRNTVDVDQLEGKVQPVPDGSAIILIAPPSDVAQWRELIAQFDEREEVIQKSYAPRLFVVGEISSLVEQIGRDSGPRGSGDQWRMVVDELTGTLIVSATPSEHEQIQALVARLDAMPAEARRPVRAFRIRNRSVNEIVEVVSSLLDAGVFEGGGFDSKLDFASPGLRQQNLRQSPIASAGAAQRTPARSAGQPTSEDGPANRNGEGRSAPLTLTADEGTNTLIAMGEVHLLQQLGSLIETLDVRQAQVMIEVLVVSLTDEQTQDLGVEIEKLEITGGTLISLSSLFGLSTAAEVAGSAARPQGRGFTGVVLRPGDFSVVVRALERLNEGRALTMPRVLVNNNQQAKVDSVLQEPLLATNASDTVATTSFGGTQDAGTTVTAVPQIAEGDHIVLEYSVSISAFVGESTDSGLPPPRQQNTLQSVVTIPDGYTVAVGGLEIAQDANAQSQIPLLGSIPIIGEAFKNRSKSNSRTRFYVFIRPNILRHEGFEDLKYISDRDVIAADIDDGWPEVHPRIVR